MEKVRIPYAWTYVKTQDVRKQGHDPLKEEDAALQTEIDEHVGETRKPVFKQSHEAMEEDIDFTHVKRIEVVH